MSYRIMVRSRPKEADREAFEKAFQQVSETVRGTPGHVRDELLRDTEDDSLYLLYAEWDSEEAFRRWEDDPSHLEMAAPMLPYVAEVTEERRIFQVRARVDSV
jgi:heme-degrading monooxygenase HmoA